MNPAKITAIEAFQSDDMWKEIANGSRKLLWKVGHQVLHIQSMKLDENGKLIAYTAEIAPRPIRQGTKLAIEMVMTHELNELANEVLSLINLPSLKLKIGATDYFYHYATDRGDLGVRVTPEFLKFSSKEMVAGLVENWLRDYSP